MRNEEIGYAHAKHELELGHKVNVSSRFGTREWRPAKLLDGAIYDPIACWFCDYENDVFQVHEEV